MNECHLLWLLLIGGEAELSFWLLRLIINTQDVLLLRPFVLYICYYGSTQLEFMISTKIYQCHELFSNQTTYRTCRQKQLQRFVFPGYICDI